MDKVLYIYTDTGSEKQNFPYAEKETLEIYDFSFSASRMEIPTLSATLKYPECLDNKWDYRQYVELKGERYWVSKIPSSSKDNTDHRYKHDLEFVSERNILSNIYFYDIVDGESEQGKYHSNSASVIFYGTLSELVERINASLRYSNVDYSVVVDSAIDTDVETKLQESKEFSCENIFVFDALNQAFETWDIPFYFVGKVCHFGYFSKKINREPLQYGADNALLKIERTNANTRVVTRATGVGSTDNIPFYYPNDSEKGNFTFTTDIEEKYEIIDSNKLATSVDDGVTYQYIGEYVTPNLDYHEILVNTHDADYPSLVVLTANEEIPVNENSQPHDIYVYFTIEGYNANVYFSLILGTNADSRISLSDASHIYLQTSNGGKTIQSWSEIRTNSLTTNITGGIPEGEYRFFLSSVNVKKSFPLTGEYTYQLSKIDINTYTDDSIQCTAMNWWIPNNDTSKKISSLRSIGIDYNEEPPHLINYQLNEGYTGKDLNKTFTLKLIEGEKFVYQDRLMPSIFAEGRAFDGNVTADMKGVERYYDAKNNTYPNVIFANELNAFNRSENIYQYDDIKPGIKNVYNTDGQLICEIADIAYDDNDSDATLGEEYGEDSNKYAHPYFYIKLRKTDAPNDFGFNLFNRATEKDSMTIQMTSGNLNGCKFKVQVVDKGNNEFANPVQVDEYGNIVAGDKDKKVSLSNFIDSQQDTRNNEVWVAVLKDQDTFGIIMPNVDGNFHPIAGDTFNITGIHLPKAYIIAAQELLDENIVNDMAKENKETFNHSIDFSRIFLKEDYDTNNEKSWLSLLNETVKIPIHYNGATFEQYVSSYTFECKGNELLPKITIELSNKIAKNETFEDNIVKKSANQVTLGTTRNIWNNLNNQGFATQRDLRTKATISNTLGGYGIEDAYIGDDGTIVLGKSSIRPLTIVDQINTLDWSQITNKPDYFELDENGDVKVKNGKGLYSESFVSAKGKDDDTSGGTGIDIARMWEELANKSTGSESYSTIIDESHIPDTIARTEVVNEKLSASEMWALLATQSANSNEIIHDSHISANIVRIEQLADYATKKELDNIKLTWKNLN